MRPYEKLERAILEEFERDLNVGEVIQNNGRNKPVGTRSYDDGRR
jgi:hypothetical protein